ncbi:MAG: hypothetical protein JWN93_920, partial [Hyphomicrobiales bacterium]|nr:hypothetical protein [Hyphomicrobiales bacterium]
PDEGAAMSRTAPAGTSRQGACNFTVSRRLNPLYGRFDEHIRSDKTPGGVSSHKRDRKSPQRS